MIVLYNIYAYLIAFPILVLNTLITSILTILLFPWPNCKFIHWVQVTWSKSFFFWLMLPVKVDGIENLDPKQSYVFVCNHQSMLDVWLHYGYLPANFKWMMKKELRKVPFVGTACHAARHVFVDRSNPRAALRSMEVMKNTLKDGISTSIFPEGTRTKNGKMGPFKRGAFQIALEMGLPVVPLTISGCYEVLPPKRWYLTPGPITLHIDKPIILTDCKGREKQEQVISEIHDIVESHLH